MNQRRSNHWRSSKGPTPGMKLPKPLTKEQRRINRIRWLREQDRLEAIKVPKAEFVADTKKHLLAYNEFHTGGATYERRHGQWTCTYAAHYLSFLLKKTPADAKVELVKRGYEWEWREPISPLSEGNAAAPDLPEQGDGNRVINDRARSTNVPDSGGGERLAPTTATAALQHRCSAVASVFPYEQAGVVNNGGQHSTAVGSA